MTVHYLTEQVPAYFLKQPRFLTGQPLPSYGGELFSTTAGDFVRKRDLTLRDVGTGPRARQAIDPRDPTRYQRSPVVQPEPYSVPMDRRVLTGPTLWPERVERSIEAQPPGGEVHWETETTHPRRQAHYS